MRFIKKSCLGLMLAGLVIPSFASADIVTNLQEHWAMDDDITSDSGTHDGTFSSLDGAGPNFVAGQFGQAVDLERDNVEYIEVQNSVTDFDYVGGSISVSCWINFEDDQSNWQAVISNGEGSAWRLAAGTNQGMNTSQTQAVWTAGGDRNELLSMTTVFDSMDEGFHHLVGTFDGETGLLSYYVDGQLISRESPTEDPEAPNFPRLTDNVSGTLAAEGPTEDNPNPGPALGITIGNNSDIRNRNFDGIIDDVGIWDAALTEEEVLMLWNGGAGMSIASIVGGATPSPIGDFDGDGDVDCDDLDGYIGNIGASVAGMTEGLANLDFDGDEMITQADINSTIMNLVVTSNGITGTFLGDLNCDGIVDVLGDAFLLVGSLNSPATMYSQGDLNFNGSVDVLGDAFILVGNLGSSNAAPKVTVFQTSGVKL